MIGNQPDILARLKAAMPPWFGNGATTILDAALTGPANALAFIYGLIQYAQLQTRIKTATDTWLDLIARDFFARKFQRRSGELDVPYRTRIVKEIFRPRATRPAVIGALTDLTGKAPIIFEPTRVADTGEWGGPFFAYGGTSYPFTGTTVDSTLITVDSTTITADAGPTPFAGIGGWGSLNYPYQFLVTAYRPPGAGIPSVDGYGGYLGGYGIGAIEYISLTQIAGPVTDAEIYSTIAVTTAAGVTAWTKITS